MWREEEEEEEEEEEVHFAVHDDKGVENVAKLGKVRLKVLARSLERQVAHVELGVVAAGGGAFVAHGAHLHMIMRRIRERPRLESRVWLLDLFFNHPLLCSFSGWFAALCSRPRDPHWDK